MKLTQSILSLEQKDNPIYQGYLPYQDQIID